MASSCDELKAVFLFKHPEFRPTAGQSVERSEPESRHFEIKPFKKKRTFRLIGQRAYAII